MRHFRQSAVGSSENAPGTNRKFAISRFLILSTSVPILVGIAAIGFSFTSIDQVYSNILKEVGAVLISTGLVGVYLEVYLYDKGVSGHSAKDVLDEVQRHVTEMQRLTKLKPETLKSSEDMYHKGADIVEHAGRRLTVFQRTPSILLGPKPYDKATKRPYEVSFIQDLDRRIEAVKNNEEMRFLYLFSYRDTKETISEHPTLLATVRSNVEKYKKIQEETHGRFRIEGAEGEISGPLAVGDSTYMIWVAQQKSTPNILVLASNEALESIHDDLRQLAGDTTDEEMKEKLELS